MGPTWGPPGSCRPQLSPCWPHEPCHLGYYRTMLGLEYNRFIAGWLLTTKSALAALCFGHEWLGIRFQWSIVLFKMAEEISGTISALSRSKEDIISSSTPPKVSTGSTQIMQPLQFPQLYSWKICTFPPVGFQNGLHRCPEVHVN